MKKLFILASFLFFGCGNEPNKKQNLSNDKGFDDIKKTFLNEANKRGHKLTWKDVNIPISFTNLEKVSGICFWDRIEIKSNLRNNPFELERVVLHELGHCVLKRKHTEDLSIMKSGANIDLFHNRKIFFDELFLKVPVTTKLLVSRCQNIFGRIFINQQDFIKYERAFLPISDREEIKIYNKTFSIRNFKEEFTNTLCRSQKPLKDYEIITIFR